MLKTSPKIKHYKLLLLLLLSLQVACSNTNYDPYEHLNAKQMFDQAKVSMNSGEFTTAIKLFEALEARYPFGRYALQAQLDIAYAYYKQNQTEAAIAACNRFIKLNPRHPQVDYAWYLKGLTNYNKGRGFFENLAPRDFAELDQSLLQTAYREFETLVTRYPQSKYVADASQRMVYLRNKMAEHEYRVANYYFERGALLGSINRGKYILEHFDGAPIVPDTLALMIRAYKQLDLTQLATDTLELLRLNYPAHPVLEQISQQAS